MDRYEPPLSTASGVAPLITAIISCIGVDWHRTGARSWLRPGPARSRGEALLVPVMLVAARSAASDHLNTALQRFRPESLDPGLQSLEHAPMPIGSPLVLAVVVPCEEACARSRL
ncbi:hypothetical protein KRMM14A1004_15320 [Krasilnikovia sp. MM14-A1004]